MQITSRKSRRSARANRLITAIAVFWFSTFTCRGQIQMQWDSLPHSDRFENFDPQFIASHDIKTIRAKISQKDEYYPIKRTGESLYFKFYRDGNLKTFRSKRWRSSDSIRIDLEYNDRSQLIKKREVDLFGPYIYQYQYTRNKVDKAFITRPAKYYYEPEQYSFTNKKYDDKTLQQISYDDMGNRVYRVLKKRNKNGELILYIKDYYVSKKRIEYNWKYQNSRIEVLTVTETSQLGETKTTKYQFIYENQKIDQIEVFVNGELVRHHEYLYKKGILDARISKEESTNRITIIEFDYTFY